MAEFDYAAEPAPTYPVVDLQRQCQCMYPVKGAEFP